MHSTNTTTEMRLADDFRHALSWLSVIEVASGTSVRFAGWILAQFGATVTSVEGISWRDSYWAERGVSDWMSADKRLIPLDAVRPRLESVDAVITDVADTRLADAGIVRGAVTAMPAPAFIRLDDADLRSYEGELALAASSGLLAAVGNANAEPLNVPDEHYQLHVGIHMAAATLRAVMADGPPETVVSGIDVLTGYTAIFSALYDSFGIAFQREGHRAPGSMGRYPLMLMRCADGHCCLVARTRAEWEALLDMLEPAVAVEALRKIDPRRTLGSEADAADKLFAEALRDWTRDEVLQMCLERGVPCAPVTLVDELLSDPHLASRSFFTTRTLDSSSEVELPQVPLRVVAGRQRPSWPDNGGRHALETRNRGLSELRVLDLGRVWSAPLLGVFLADLGADVVKVESASRPDPNRGRSSHTGSPVPPPTFVVVNRGKRAIALDLKSDSGRDVALKLVEECDVLLENFSPGVLDRLGLGYDVLRERNERLVCLSMSAAGSSGRYAAMKGYGSSISSLGGVEGTVGYPPDDVVGALGADLSDLGAASWGLVAVLAGLNVRSITGAGCWIDLSQMEAIVAKLGDSLVDSQTPGDTMPLGNVHRRFVPYGVHRTRGHDRWIAVSCASQPQRDALWALLGQSGSSTGVSGEEWNRLLAHWCATRDGEEIEAVLRPHGIAAAVAHLPSEAVDRSGSSRSHLVYDGVVCPRLSWSPAGTAHPGASVPAVGQHTEEILRDWLGADAAAIDGWAREGAFA